MAKRQTELQIEQFALGSNFRLWELLGARPARQNGQSGYIFRTWAPRAKRVAVVGDFNGWKKNTHRMKRREDSGIWELFVPGLSAGECYQYAIAGKTGGSVLKFDPFAHRFCAEPDTCPVLGRPAKFGWTDAEWLQGRAEAGALSQPVSIYQMHLGSWRRDEDGQPYTYARLAKELPEYLSEMGYTHVEFLPLTEHLSKGDWGYLVSGYFAATARYGRPEELKQLVDALHRAGIGVIMDWSPAQFPIEEQGLYLYDGSPCFEYSDPLKANHANWNTRIFDYGKPEVRAFLISSALYWLEEYHIDGLRLDAISAMLYLDYDRQEGEWRPNIYGGRENLEAVEFLQALNNAVARAHPDVLMIAEETTAWPGVTRPSKAGGIGFRYKWATSWIEDMQEYIALAPEYRVYNHDKLTFSTRFAFNENFILPLSHNEVVHGKRALLSKFPGGNTKKFAGARLFLGYMMAHPGKKLQFMGSEFGQIEEWSADKALDWGLLEEPAHRQLRLYMRTLNRFYKRSTPLWQLEDSWEGFRWIVPDDNKNNVLALRRRDQIGRELVVVCNFSDTTYEQYRIGVPTAHSYRQVLSSNELRFGGTGEGNPEPIRCEPIPSHSKEQSIAITVPAMSCLWLAPYRPRAKSKQA